MGTLNLKVNMTSKKYWGYINNSSKIYYKYYIKVGILFFSY